MNRLLLVLGGAFARYMDVATGSTALSLRVREGKVG